MTKIRKRPLSATVIVAAAILGTTYLANPASVFDTGSATSSAHAFFHSETKTIDGRIVVHYPTDLPEDAVAFLLEKITKADRTIRELLDAGKKKYTVEVSSSIHRPRVNEWRDIVYLPASRAEKKQSGPIWHELTHILTGRARNFFYEGLAEWVRHTYSPTSKQDMHWYVKKKGMHKSHPVSRIVKYRPTDAPPGNERNAQYSVADSFVKYLIEDVSRGEIKPFLRFYRDGANNYVKHFRQTFEQLAKGWQSRIATYNVGTSRSSRAPEKEKGEGLALLRSGTEIHLHDPNQTPLHLGDALGQIDDIVATGYFAENPLQERAWDFLVETLLEQVNVRISAFSVTIKFPKCKTLVFLNGARIAILNEFEGAGDGRDVNVNISVDSKHVKTGSNSLSIKQAKCLGDSYDDILIKSISVSAK